MRAVADELHGVDVLASSPTSHQGRQIASRPSAESTLSNLWVQATDAAALTAPDLDARVAAVTCLVFLAPEGAGEELARLAVVDREPGVRRVALWAQGFVGFTCETDLLERRAREDSAFPVRAFQRSYTAS